MDRRNFLRLATTGVAAAAALKGTLLDPRRLVAAPSISKRLSLAVITDEPDVAIPRFEKLFNLYDLHAQALTFDECILPGAQIGDIAVVHNNKLVDFRRSRDEFFQQVLEIAHELDLPREMENPLLLRFATKDRHQQAWTVNVYHRRELLRQYDIKDQFSGEKVEGTRGPLFFSLQHRHVHVASASCKHKTCMSMGSIHKPGQNLVCIPNELRIAIAGENELGIDGITF